MNASGGIVAQGAIEWTVRALGRAQSVDDLRRTVVATRGDVPVLLGDVADVREAAAVRRGVAHRLKGEVVSARIIKQFGADTVTVAAGIRTAVDDIRRTLPKGVQLRIVYDQSQLVSSALGGVGRAVLLGGVFVVLVIVALLGNVRAAVVVTLTMPLSIALAGLLLKPLGIGLNTMTLGGLAIAVGLLVDAAIIMVENILHRSTGAQGASERKERALLAASEVARPIAFATLHRHCRVPAAVRDERHRRSDVSAAGRGGDRGDDGGAHPGAHARADCRVARAEDQRARTRTRTWRCSGQSSACMRRRSTAACGALHAWPW